MTEEMNREGIERILRQNGIDRDRGFIRDTPGAYICETQGVYQDVRESSITIWVWSENHESVIKAATEIGIMNRQHTVRFRGQTDLTLSETLVDETSVTVADPSTKLCPRNWHETPLVVDDRD
jgi:hypothetical protein